MTTQDPSLLVAALSRDQVSLKLDTFDLCCLAGLYLRAGRDGLASFEEALLLDVFGQICDVVEPGAENRRKRATHATQRLRDQCMLSRIDGVGFVAAGEYTLSRLAASIVEYFLTDDERIVNQTIMKKVASALRALGKLGFIDLLGDDQLKLRPALMRFVEPVRGLNDRSAALERLMALGELERDAVSNDEDLEESAAQDDE